jgi:tetratricopeptide (TPR) repeat protein
LRIRINIRTRVFRGIEKLLLLLLISISSAVLAIPDQTDLQSQTNVNQISLDADSIEGLLIKGIGKMQSGDYNLARLYFQEARTRSNNQDSTRFNILAITNIGILYYYLNEPDSALTYYYLALDMAENSGSLNLQNTINNNIGVVYATTGHQKEAQKVMEKALAISVLLNDTLKMALNLTNLGAQNIILNDLWAAKSNLLRAEEYYNKLGNLMGLGSVNTSMGELNFIDSNYIDALTRFKVSLNMAQTNAHAIEISLLYYNLGRTEFALKNYDLALSYLDTAYNTALENNQLDEASKALNKLIEVFSELNQNEKAIEYAWKSLAIKDSIIKIEKANWIEESKVKYQFELKKREYDLFQKNAERRTFFVSLILSALIIIIVLLVVILRMRKKTSFLKEEKHLFEKSLTKEKLSKAKTRNMELEERIETINYELVSKTLLIDNKNQILDSIGSLLNEAEINDGDNNQHVRQLKQHLLRDSNVEQNWEDFKVYFERVHTSFFQKIHKDYPNLTSSDLRLLAFVLLQLNAKEISQIINITPDSVRKRKQRLRNKLNLEKGDDLLNFLYSYTS